MSDVKQVLLERLINHRFTAEGITRVDQSALPIWDHGQSDEHQEWIFGDRVSLKKLSLQNKGALTDDFHGHQGVNSTEVTKAVIDSVQTFISAMTTFNELFPDKPTNGDAYSQYDLYCLVRDKLLWTFDHGRAHCPECLEKANDELHVISKHTGY